jgi:hypothetical protein
MRTFKYNIVIMEYTWEDKTISSVLNNLGAKGWELMNIDGQRYTFKKEIL